MSKEKLPTAEEVLKQEVLKVTNGVEYEHNITNKGIVSAMEEYKDLYTGHLLERIKELNKSLKNLKKSLAIKIGEKVVVQLENERLREALESIYEILNTRSDLYAEDKCNRIEDIAKEALKPKGR